jgi:hypothetical protein
MAVDAAKIAQGVLGMGLRGNPETGLLRGFGVILAINLADYLVGRELEYLRRYPDAMEMMEASLVDAAQWCANATFGGMMKSPEWDGLCAPMIANTRDQLEALHAVQNCLGWGHVSDYAFDPEKRSYRMVVKHSYYVDNYLRKFGASDRPRCYMWTGVAAGNMDLLLGGKIHEFEAKEVQCAAMGADACVFEARPVPKLFDLL